MPLNPSNPGTRTWKPGTRNRREREEAALAPLFLLSTFAQLKRGCWFSRLWFSRLTAPISTRSPKPDPPACDKAWALGRNPGPHTRNPGPDTRSPANETKNRRAQASARRKREAVDAAVEEARARHAEEAYTLHPEPASYIYYKPVPASYIYYIPVPASYIYYIPASYIYYIPASYICRRSGGERGAPTPRERGLHPAP